ncbi:MAG: FecR family protein, partial [Bacteroidota bacterium]
MYSSRVHYIIVKFLNREASKADLEELELALREASNSTLFRQLVRIEHLIALCMGDYDVEKAKAAIKKKLRDRERKERARQLKRWSVAASFLLVLGLSLYLTLDWEKMREPAAAEIITSGASRAVLTLGDGEEVALAQGQGYRATDINSNGIELVYEGKGTKKPTQNYLTVPRGGQFVLNLADGTKVWVNSESKLKYPTRFVAGETRNVELLYGEAYFEVSPSEQHEGDRFSVLTKGQKIVVLGTKFNVQAHRGDAEVITTLTEGRVVVERGEFTESLGPNQRSILDDDTQEIRVEAATAEAASSWSEG